MLRRKARQAKDLFLPGIVQEARRLQAAIHLRPGLLVELLVDEPQRGDASDGGGEHHCQQDAQDDLGLKAAQFGRGGHGGGHRSRGCGVNHSIIQNWRNSSCLTLSDIGSDIPWSGYDMGVVVFRATATERE